MARIPSANYSAYESITVATTAIGFSANLISGKTVAYMTLETAQIRYRLDGTAPTATEGHVLDFPATLELSGATNLANFKAIRTGATSGVLKCSYG